MKNKLWVFGCSFGTGFNQPGKDVDYNWPFLLSEKLNLHLNNFASPGLGNWENILKFVDVRDDISENDYIIFQFTFFDRINFFPHIRHVKTFSEYFSKNNYEEFAQVNKDVNFEWFKKHILNWSQKRKIKLYCITAEGQFSSDFDRYANIINFIPAPNHSYKNPNYSFYTGWQDDNEETWIKLDNDYDKHFNKLGHDIMANNILTHINDTNFSTYKIKIL